MRQAASDGHCWSANNRFPCSSGANLHYRNNKIEDKMIHDASYRLFARDNWRKQFNLHKNVDGLYDWE